MDLESVVPSWIHIGMYETGRTKTITSMKHEVDDADDENEPGQDVAVTKQMKIQQHEDGATFCWTTQTHMPAGLHI
jgi:hypothetical protein